MQKRILLFFIFLSVFIIKNDAQQFIDKSAQQSLSFYANKLQNLNIGAAVGSNFYSVYDNGDTYNKTIQNNFNILVAENEMKFDAMEPSKGVFSYSNADNLVTYAQKYNMQIRGHNLCWHSQLPSWVSSGSFTRATLMAVLKNHITTIVTRYKGKISQWDVVNEPFNDGTGTLRSSVWQQTIGNDYIDSAFVWAHRADPAAKLYLNEYGGEIYGDTKSEAMYTYVKSMKDRGIPITGVGFQCHFTANSINFVKLNQNIKRYGTAGLEVLITELDIKIKVSDYNANKTTWLTYQANDYKNMIRACLDNSNCKTFVTWGFTDLYSWIPNFTSNVSGYALLFDNSYIAKPAYTSILNELVTESNKTAINSLNSEPEIKIVITRDQVAVKTENEIFQCQLFDTQGKMIYSINVNDNSIQIPLQNTPHRIYLLRILFNTGRVITQKFIH